MKSKQAKSQRANTAKFEESDSDTAKSEILDEGDQESSDVENPNDCGTESEEDLSKTATESDEDSDESEDDASKSAVKNQNLITKSTLVQEKISNKYNRQRGTRLYIRFPSKLPKDNQELEDKVKAISPQIIKVHKPRQQHARFCIAEFSSQHDRDSALKCIKTYNESKSSKPIIAQIPRTENEEFVKDLIERKLQKIDEKKAKNRLKRAVKKANLTKQYTSSIVACNLPATITVQQLKELFPSAIDVQLRVSKGKVHGPQRATITLPSTLAACKIVKEKFSLSGSTLSLRFDKKDVTKKNRGKLIGAAGPEKKKKVKKINSNYNEKIDITK